MKKIQILSVIAGFAIFIAACGNHNNGKTESNTPVPTTAPVVKNLRLERFDILEKIFQNENWLVLDGNDSSYLYCSRLGQRYFKTYQYKMSKGDSTHTMIAEIKLSTDTITWVLPVNNTPVYLNKVSANELVWADYKNLDVFVFQKTDSDHILLKLPNGESRNLIKTITLASFLVRSKYDYLHRTRFAFDRTRK